MSTQEHTLNFFPVCAFVAENIYCFCNSLRFCFQNDLVILSQVLLIDASREDHMTIALHVPVRTNNLILFTRCPLMPKKPCR